jgi:hypothetical protein
MRLGLVTDVSAALAWRDDHGFSWRINLCGLIPPEVPPVALHEHRGERAQGSNSLIDNVTAIGVLLAG